MLVLVNFNPLRIKQFAGSVLKALQFGADAS
jgi:hypothetical protein